MMLKERTFLLTVLIYFVRVSSKPTDPGLKIQQVLDLVPIETIEEIEQAHLKVDQGFRAAVYYLQSKEWRDLVDAVLQKPEYEKFVKMAKKYNLDILRGINCTRKHIDSLKISEKPTAEPNLEPFITKVQSVIPIGTIAQTLMDKLGKDEVKRLLEEVASEENRKIVEAVHNLPEMVKMRQILRGMKFDVEPYIALVFSFLGLVH